MSVRRLLGKRSLWMVGLVVVLAPTQALAAVCFSINSFTTVIVTVSGSGEGFLTLAGEALSTCQLPNGQPSGQSAPATGTGRLQLPSQNARFSLFIGGTQDCFPISVQGTLLFPAYNSGSGTVENSALTSSSNATIAPSGCPPLN